MMQVGTLRSGTVLAIAVGFLVPSVADAQAARGRKAAPGGVEIEEITVTAQKREENIQEIPISVTAVSGEMLREQQVTKMLELTQVVPNLHIQMTTGSVSNLILAMRGVQVGDNNITVQPPIGLYVDGAYIAHLNGNNLDLEDLERVETLRGPQGTLYGRNTIGGAINLITKKPTDERSITVATRVGNFDTFKGRVTANIPLVGKNGFFQSDALGTIAIRQNAAYESHDGYFRNTYQPKPRDLNDLNRVFTMTALRWQPRKTITIDYSFEYHRYRNGSTLGQVAYVYPKSPVDGGFFNLNPYVHWGRIDGTPLSSDLIMPDRQYHRPADDGNHRMHNLTGAWDLGEVGPLGSVTLRSISSYRLISLEQVQDLDGSPLQLFNADTTQRYEHWSQELQWVGTAPRVHYVLGAYYFGEYTTDHNPQSIFNNASRTVSDNTQTVSTIAPFGQLTYTPPILNDKLSITGGIRYTHEQVHVDRNYQSLSSPALSFKSSRGKAFGGTDAISPLGDISFEWTPEVMTYFRVSRGFRSGGFNGRASTPSAFAIPFNPEKLTQYELGFKTQWFNNRLRLNADGFFSDYKDQQVTVTQISSLYGAVFTTANAASSELWGTEVELTAVPLRGLEVTGQYGFLTGKYNEFNDIVGGKPVNVADEREAIRAQPPQTITLGATYTAPPTSHGTFAAHIDGYWQDRILFDLQGPQIGRQGNYFLANGRLSFTGIPLAKGGLDIAVFCRNLLDKTYRQFSFDGTPALGWVPVYYAPPRTFGLELTYNYTHAEAAPPPPPVAQAAPPPPPPAKKKIVLRSVHFDFDKATLKAEAKPILDEAVQVLKQEGSVDIIVEGHTDSVGTEQYNLNLSRRRAETVRRYLVERGVASSRIAAEGMGESRPVASNDTADGRAQNRRVELHVK